MPEQRYLRGTGDTTSDAVRHRAGAVMRKNRSGDVSLLPGAVLAFFGVFNSIMANGSLMEKGGIRWQRKTYPWVAMIACGDSRTTFTL